MSSRVTLPTNSGCKTPICSCAFLHSSSSSSPRMTYPHMQMILTATTNLQVNPQPSSRPVAEGHEHPASRYPTRNPPYQPPPSPHRPHLPQDHCACESAGAAPQRGARRIRVLRRLIPL